MQKANETKSPRTQKNKFVIEGALVRMIDAASGALVALWDMNALPDHIKLRILGQGGSTILQQRKSGKEGREALETMEAHFANWMAGNWEMERKAPRALAAWVFPALCLKLPKVAPAKILAALEVKRAEADDAAWADFLKELEPYRAQLAQEVAEAPEDDLTL